MNPMTNELRRSKDISGLIKKGFIPIPKKLHKAAELKLGDKDSVFVSKTSGGKLSKWAAKKRREIRRAQKQMVDNCNNYYSNL